MTTGLTIAFSERWTDNWRYRRNRIRCFLGKIAFVIFFTLLQLFKLVKHLHPSVSNGIHYIKLCHPCSFKSTSIIKRFPKNVDVYSENPLVLSHTWTSSIVVTIFRKNIVQTRCKSSPSGYFETNDVRSRTLKCQIAMSQNMRFGYLAPWLAEFPPRDHNWWCHAHALARSATRHKQDKRIWSSVKIWYMVDKN